MNFKSLLANKYATYFFYGLSGVFFLWLFYGGPVLQGDSASYIYGSPFRSPIYPLILKTYNFVFEGNYQVLIFLQLLFGYVCIHKLTSIFRTTYKTSDLVTTIIFGILVLPYLYHSGQFILSESVTYPLFLLFLSCLLNGVFNKTAGSLFLSIILSGVLVMTRNQFAFLYVFLGALVAYLFLLEKEIKKTVLLSITLLSVIVSANMLEKSYHYLNSGSFSSIPTTGKILINNFLYLADASDEALFEDKNEQEFFKVVRKEISEKGYIREAKPSDISTAHHLELVYDQILYTVVSKHTEKYLGTNPYEVDKKLMSMSCKLMAHNFGGWVKLFFGKILRGLGGYWFAIISLAGMLVCLPRLFKRNNILSITYVSLFSLTLLNLVLIGLVHYPLIRYTIYTQLPLICFVIILLEKAMNYGESLKS